MGYNLSSRLLQFRGLSLLTVVNVTRIIASAMATAKILHNFPRRPLMGLDAPKADRDADHDLAIASVLGLPPGSAAAAWSVAAASVYSIGERKPRSDRGLARKQRTVLTCPSCGKTRELLPSDAKGHKGSYCGPCWCQSLAKNAHLIARARLDKALVGVHNRNDLAVALGVSRQRVHQLLTAHGINLPGVRLEARVIWTCVKCGLIKITTPSNRPKRTICPRCYAEQCHVVLVCPTCGKARRTKRSQARHYKSELCRACWRQAWGHRFGLEIGQYNLAAYQVKRRKEKEQALTSSLPLPPNGELVGAFL